MEQRQEHHRPEHGDEKDHLASVLVGLDDGISPIADGIRHADDEHGREGRQPDQGARAVLTPAHRGQNHQHGPHAADVHNMPLWDRDRFDFSMVSSRGCASLREDLRIYENDSQYQIMGIPG
jgi:hypothetical protein